MTTLHYANTHDSDMLYAVRVTAPDSFFYIENAEGKRYVFFDSREYGVFQDHNHQEDLECVLLDPLLTEAAALPFETSVANRLALLILQRYASTNETVRVSNRIPVDMADFLRAQGVKLDITDALFPQRIFKAQWEKDAIRESLKRTQLAFKRIEEVLRDSDIVGDEIHYNGVAITSEWMKMEAEKVMLEADMMDTEGIIISCGDHAAIPHHQGAGLLRPHQTIVCDIFPRRRENGYFSDMTRTYVKGEPSEEVRKMYNAVYTAQQACIKAIKAGVSAHEMHLISVEYFKEQGFVTEAPNGFVHGTGHGLGLDIHEPPRMNATTGETLEEGHVVTVEPGLYYKGVGGVRIEDVVYVTKEGSEDLTAYPADNWIIA